MHAVGVGVVAPDTEPVCILDGAVGVQVVAAPAGISDDGVCGNE